MNLQAEELNELKRNTDQWARQGKMSRKEAVAMDEIEHLRSECQWISVDERLPESPRGWEGLTPAVLCVTYAVTATGGMVIAWVNDKPASLVWVLMTAKQVRQEEKAAHA